MYVPSLKRISALWTGPVRPPGTTQNPSRSKLCTARFKLGTITTAWSNLAGIYSSFCHRTAGFARDGF